jgi:hypothetical protein
MKDKDAKTQSLQQEIENLEKKLREAKEEVADRDGQIKVVNMNLNNSEKQRAHLNSEV